MCVSVVAVVVVDWADVVSTVGVEWADVVAVVLSGSWTLVVAGGGEEIGDWPEVVVVGGEGIGLLVNPGTGTSHLMILEVPDASCWSKASSSSLISSIVSSAITLHDLVVGVLVLDIIRNRYTLLSEDPGSTETVGCTRGLGWG